MYTFFILLNFMQYEFLGKGSFLHKTYKEGLHVHSVYGKIVISGSLKLSPNYKYLAPDVKLACTSLAALYQCCQTRPLSSSLQCGQLADSQPAESA